MWSWALQILQISCLILINRWRLCVSVKRELLSRSDRFIHANLTKIPHNKQYFCFEISDFIPSCFQSLWQSWPGMNYNGSEKNERAAPFHRYYSGVARIEVSMHKTFMCFSCLVEYSWFYLQWQRVPFHFFTN